MKDLNFVRLSTGLTFFESDEEGLSHKLHSEGCEEVECTKLVTGGYRYIGRIGKRKPLSTMTPTHDKVCKICSSKFRGFAKSKLCSEVCRSKNLKANALAHWHKLKAANADQPPRPRKARKFL